MFENDTRDLEFVFVGTKFNLFGSCFDEPEGTL